MLKWIGLDFMNRKATASQPARLSEETKDRRAVAVLAVLLILVLLLGCILGQTGEVEAARGTVTGRSDLDGMTFAAVSGTESEQQVREAFPNAEVLPVSDRAEAALAVSGGNADAMLCEQSGVSAILAEYDNLTALPEPLTGSQEEEPVYAIIRTEEYAYTSSDGDWSVYNREGVRIAAMLGTDQQIAVEDCFPLAEGFYTSTMSDSFEALESGKVEGAIGYIDNLGSVFESYSDLEILCTPVEYFSYGFATGKNSEGEALCREMNEYFAELEDSGELSRIIEKWKNAEDGSYAPESYVFTGENGVLKVGTSGTWCPMSFYSGSTLVGEFIDLVNGFCAAYGYTPEYECVTFEAEIAGVTSGTYDLVADSIVITEERLQSVNITTPLLAEPTYLFVKAEKTAQTGAVTSRLTSFGTSLKNSFERTFIREDRWKMLLSGLEVTVALALLAGVFGSLLGAGICALRMSKRRYPQALGMLYIKVIQGTPIVVLLMLLYYVVFGDSRVTAFWVCVIGFSVDFAAYVAEIYRSAIEAVPAGEIQAARALGFTSFGAFRQVTLPQAVTNGLPVFSGQFVAMVKQTSVAGYISVQDLTKVSDIIRSRTYEAFFPLITTAVIYFLLSAWLISRLKKLEKRLNPALRPRTIKGVKIHD